MPINYSGRFSSDTYPGLLIAGYITMRVSREDLNDIKSGNHDEKVIDASIKYGGAYRFGDSASFRVRLDRGMNATIISMPDPMISGLRLKIDTINETYIRGSYAMASPADRGKFYLKPGTDNSRGRACGVM